MIKILIDKWQLEFDHIKEEIKNAAKDENRSKIDLLYPRLRVISEFIEDLKDAYLLESYTKGWEDELDGKEKKIINNILRNKAYFVGRSDAIMGDDISSIDLQTNEEILKRIKE